MPYIPWAQVIASVLFGVQLSEDNFVAEAGVV